MVKKISFYTAFGQFLNMVERQLELEEISKQHTDRLPIDHPLSDYQNTLGSDIQMRSCPADFSASNGPVDLRKAISCPLASFAPIVCCDPIPSPVPTSIESRKMNEATDMMLSFWKVNVTVRPKRKNVEIREEIPSLFEKLDGFFQAPTVPVHSVRVHVEDLFDDTGFSEAPSLVTDPESELTDCSWCETWKAIETRKAPTLPVFVKSPIDSLKYYKKNKFHPKVELDDGELADDELSATANTSTSCHSAATVIREDKLENRRNKLLSKVISQQNKTISLLIELDKVSMQLEKRSKN